MPSGRRSSVVEAHEAYMKYHKHHVASDDDEQEEVEGSAEYLSSVKTEEGDPWPQFHRVEKTGVIYATSRAKRHGFDPEDPAWANMGQGAPETGPLPGAPSRNFNLSIPDAELEYAPVTGNPHLRAKVADYYNALYRKGMPSQYTAANVCIVPGGRAGLTRIMAILANVQVGYFCPDYTAYEQALGLFLRISPSPLLHRDVNEAVMDAEEFAFQCSGRGVGAILLSNPANPTGQSIEGERLQQYVETARTQQCSIIFDEFYSHYYYDGDAVDPQDGGADDDSNWYVTMSENCVDLYNSCIFSHPVFSYSRTNISRPKTVSSAAYIEDVNKDPILIVNGLTKNWRCPGFRICWIVAPKAIVEMLGSAGSYLDGGANAPLQLLALPLMDLDFIRRDTWALQRHFRMKRDFLLEELSDMGIQVKWKPRATFYVWADLSGLPPPLNDCLVFLEECIRKKVVIVPGVFFDINPRGINNVRKSKCLPNIRFSYGPPMRNLELGMKAIREIIQEWKDMPPETADDYAQERGYA